MTFAGHKNVKAFVLDRDNWICHYCETDLVAYDEVFPDSATIDHVIPKSKGGSNEASNLVACCSSCNGLKGSMSYDEFIAEAPWRFVKPGKAVRFGLYISRAQEIHKKWVASKGYGDQRLSEWIKHTPPEVQGRLTKVLGILLNEEIYTEKLKCKHH